MKNSSKSPRSRSQPPPRPDFGRHQGSAVGVELGPESEISPEISPEISMAKVSRKRPRKLAMMRYGFMTQPFFDWIHGDSKVRRIWALASHAPSCPETEGCWMSWEWEDVDGDNCDSCLVENGSG